jgi:hypothetical protein
VTAILWEFSEYITFIRNNENELRTAYTDTLGDLALGLGGSVVAAVITMTLGWRTRSASRSPDSRAPAMRTPPAATQ